MATRRFVTANGIYDLTFCEPFFVSTSFVNSGEFDDPFAMMTQAVAQKKFVSLVKVVPEEPKKCCEGSCEALGEAYLHTPEAIATIAEAFRYINGQSEAAKEGCDEDEPTTITVKDDGYTVIHEGREIELLEPATVEFVGGQPSVTVVLTADKVVLE